MTRILVPLNWTLWGALLVGALYALVRVATERTSSPEAGRGLGVLAVGLMLVLLAVAGVFVTIAARKQSPAGLFTMTVILAWPLVFLVADPLVRKYRERSFTNEEARVGDFRDAALAAMAGAIAGNDTATLTRLLGGRAPPAGKDRAGNDLLAFALVMVRDRKGSAAPVRALLEAGADPRQVRMGSGEDVLTYLVLGHSPEGREAMQALLEHGADPNIVDPQTERTPLGSVYQDPVMVRLLVEHGADIDRIQYGGITALVHFISTREWDSALYLIERGANLDIANADGLSVDYYLNDWKESVFGEHPEGWDKVRQAIAARRASR